MEQERAEKTIDDENGAYFTPIKFVVGPDGRKRAEPVKNEREVWNDDWHRIGPSKTTVKDVL
jgi:hypothetical protein